MTRKTNESARAKLVNALVNAAQLRVADDAQSESVDGVRYARVTNLTEDVVAATGAPETEVEIALREALAAGLLVVPASMPLSEHPPTLVRPDTL